MHWTFSWGWFFLGFVIAIAGFLIVKFYDKISYHLASGVQSFEKVKLFGVIAIAVGAVLITNLHSLILYGIFHLIMPQYFP